MFIVRTEVHTTDAKKRLLFVGLDKQRRRNDERFLTKLIE